MTRLITALLLGVALAAPALADNIVITNARIVTNGPAGTISNGTLVIVDDRIVAVGSGTIAAPPGARVIDAGGNWVTPGIIAPFTRVGISEVGAEDSTNDTSAGGSQYSVALRAAYGFNPAATPIAVTRIEGVTRVVVAPSVSSSIFAGQGFIASTSGEPGSVTNESAFIYVELGETGAARAGGSRPAAWAYF